MSNILLYSASGTLGALFFLFIYWRKMREEYPVKLIFSNAFSILFSVIIGTIVGFLITDSIPETRIFDKEGLWFWGAVLGFIISFIFYNFKNKFEFFENLETTGIGLLVWLGFISLAYGLSNLRLDAFISAILIAVLLLVYKVLASKYKTFSWYKSGRVGFAGITTLALFFLIRSGIAIYGGSMLSFAGRIEVILSSVISFLLFFAVYNLSQNR